MQLRHRALLVAAFAAGPAMLLVGCGGTSADGARSTIAEIQPTNFVTIEPATTTTTTTLPEGADPGGVSPTEQTYTVQGGDSVYRIAELFDIEPTVLANYNGWAEGINHPLLVGDTVKIPPNAAIPGATTGDSGTDTGGGDTSTDTGGGDTGTSDSTGEGCTHTVVSGDNPSRLASQYGVSLDELNNANIGNPAYSRFLIGDSINIPPEGC